MNELFLLIYLLFIRVVEVNGHTDVDNKKVLKTRNEAIKTTKSFTFYNLLKE